MDGGAWTVKEAELRVLRGVMRTLRETLGLGEGATDAEVVAAVAALKADVDAMALMQTRDARRIRDLEARTVRTRREALVAAVRMP